MTRGASGAAVGVGVGVGVAVALGLGLGDGDSAGDAEDSGVGVPEVPATGVWEAVVLWRWGVWNQVQPATRKTARSRTRPLATRRIGAVYYTPGPGRQ